MSAGRKVIEDYAELGFSRCAFIVPPTGEDDALRALDHYSGLIATYTTA